MAFNGNGSDRRKVRLAPRSFGSFPPTELVGLVVTVETSRTKLMTDHGYRAWTRSAK